MTKRFLDAFKLYWSPRLLLIFALGVASGLPLLLTSSTLTIRLREEGVDLGAIGLFALVGLPYTFKFLWAPLLDQLPIPGFTNRLGRRRGWMLAIHFLLILAIAALGLTPATGADFSLYAVGGLALLVAFLSATQDIAIDAYRVEILEENQFGAGAAMAVYGFRVGMLISTWGTLQMAEALNWELAYILTGLTLLIGVVAILVAPEPEAPPYGQSGVGVSTLLGSAYWEPLKEFAGRKGWVALLLFALIYKFGDAALSQMAGALYVDLGYDKATIANVVKLYGFAAVLIGTAVGGVLVAWLGIGVSLLIGGIIQALSNLAYWKLAAIGGPDTIILAWAVSIENVSTGIGGTAFIAFLMSLCDRRYTAAQYALLSSIVAVSPKILTAPAGFVAEAIGWEAFCVATAIAAIPGILLLLWLLRTFPESWRAAPMERADA